MGFIDRRTFSHYAPLLRAGTVRARDLVLEQGQGITVRYAPIHFVNATARVLIVGITPGSTQAAVLLQECVRGLRDGLSGPAACRRAKYAASFVGVMRTNLVRMLDGLSLQRALGIPSSADLFGQYQDLLDTASVLPYPVFVKGRNYTGHSPRLDATSWLWAYTRVFERQLRMLDRRTLIVPLGKTVSAVLRTIAPDHPACLWHFPHPSGANGHATTQFQTYREEMSRQVRLWAALISA